MPPRTDSGRIRWNMRLRKQRFHYALGLVAIPPLISALLLFVFFVQVPFWDQWWLVPLLAAQRENNLELWMLWHQHYEHRIFFPRLVMLALARFSDWDLRYEVAFNWALTCSALVVSCWYFLRTAKVERLGNWPLLASVVSLVLFSPAPFDNWLWSWQMPYFIVSAGVIVSTLLLARFGAGRGRFVAACAIAAVATLSFCTGALLWLTGAYVIWRSYRGRERLFLLSAWGGICVAILSLFLFRYEFLTNRGGEGVKSFSEALSYVLLFLGSGIVPYSSRVFAVGAGIAFLVLWWWLCKWERHLFVRKRLALIAFGSWPIFALATALLTASGRSTFHPRYIMFSQLGWLGILIFCLVLSLERKIPVTSRRVFATSAVFIVLMFLQMWGFGIAWMRWFSGQMAEYRQIVLTSNSPNELKRVYGNPHQLDAEFRPILKKYKLCLFKSIPSMTAESSPD